ncbi:hypothetical protein BJX68DRAFT_265268 [Aspergillus pseudodeflectus]|uniref:Uncharacterized protein n=1 Tax=Aspergillus pseudodeflectus TaxID=176178 RepID=A0ABR4KL78_9EURO
MAPIQPPSWLKRKTNYWHTLNRPRLTRNALREVQQRVAKPVYGPPTPAQRAEVILQGFDKKRLREISKFSRHGGPDFAGLRGFPEPQVNRDNSIEPTNTSSGEGLKFWDYGLKEQAAGPANTTAYSDNFEDHLINHLIYPPGYKYPDGREPAPPKNLEEVKEMITAPRASVSTYSKDDFEEFAITYWKVRTEQEAKDSVISILEGRTSGHAGKNRHFANLAHLTDGIQIHAKPDIYHGARAAKLDSAILNKLNDLIVPSQTDGLVAPNFFLKVKGAQVSAVEAERQACYYGALGARAIHALHSHKQEKPVFDNNAYTISATYCRGLLELYATHIASSGRNLGVPEYVMTRLGEWTIHANMESFQQGLTAYRNARDWARKKRDEAVAAANKRQSVHKPPPSQASNVRKQSMSNVKGYPKSNAGTESGNSDEAQFRRKSTDKGVTERRAIPERPKNTENRAVD